MRRLLLALALVGAGHTLGAHELAAQSRQPVWGLTTVRQGQVVEGRLTEKNLSRLVSHEGKYIKEFFYQARAGETPVVHLSGDIRGSWRMSAFVNPGLKQCGGQIDWGRGPIATCSLGAPFAKDTEVFVMLEADRPGSYRLAVYGGEDAEAFGAGAAGGRARSRTSGLQLAAGYGTVTFEGSTATGEGGWTEVGAGPGARLGLGFGPLAFIAEGQMSEMAPEGEESGGSGGYTLYHADLGSRVYFLGSGSPLRPFVQLAYGIRRIAGEAEGEDLELEGAALTPGAGAQLFLTPGLSIEGSYRRTDGDFTRIRRAGDEWIDVPAEAYMKGPTSRISAQVVVHF